MQKTQREGVQRTVSALPTTPSPTPGTPLFPGLVSPSGGHFTCKSSLSLHLSPPPSAHPPSIYLSTSPFFLFFKKYFMYLFLERGEESEKAWETSIERETLIGCLTHTPERGAGLQPRHVPWLGMEPGAQFTEPHQPRRTSLFFKHIWEHTIHSFCALVVSPRNIYSSDSTWAHTELPQSL